MFNVHFIYFFAVLHRFPRLVFLCHLVFFLRFSSPRQELEPAATPCRGGRCAARYPHGLQTAKKYFDYDYASSHRWR